jgi:hypothetical protein
VSFTPCLLDPRLRAMLGEIESLVAGGHHRAAVSRAGELVTQLATGDGQTQPAVYALLRGVSGARYLRFTRLVERARDLPVSELDALFALHFVVELALP